MPPWTPVGIPRRVVRAVDQEGDGPGCFFLVGLPLLRLREVGRGVYEFELLPVLGAGLFGEDFEFPNRPIAGLASAGSVEWQIAVGKRLELQAGDAVQVRLSDKIHFVVRMADH